MMLLGLIGALLSGKQEAKAAQTHFEGQWHPDPITNEGWIYLAPHIKVVVDYEPGDDYMYVTCSRVACGYGSSNDGDGFWDGFVITAPPDPGGIGGFVFENGTDNATDAQSQLTQWSTQSGHACIWAAAQSNDNSQAASSNIEFGEIISNSSYTFALDVRNMPVGSSPVLLILGTRWRENIGDSEYSNSYVAYQQPLNAGDLGITVRVAPKITATADTGGSISSPGVTSVGYGDDKSYTITPSTNWRIKDVKVDGVSVGAVSSYTFTNVTEDHTIHAEFAPKPKIIATADTGGSISPSGTTIVEYGGSQNYTITPSTYWKIKDVKVDGNSVGAVSSYTFTNVTEDHTIHAEFDPNKLFLDYHTNNPPPTYEGQSGRSPVTTPSGSVSSDTEYRRDTVQYDNSSYVVPVPSAQLSARGWHLQGYWKDSPGTHNLQGNTTGATNVASALGVLETLKVGDVTADVYAQWVINQGGAKLQKVDANSGGTTPQGDASLSGATYSITNRGPSAVNVSGTSYGTGRQVHTMTTGTNGAATTTSTLLPSSTYEVREASASTGYIRNTSWGGKFDIEQNGTIVDLSSTSMFGNCTETIMRGGVKVEKVDYDRKDNVTQGDAHETFEGTKYGIYNLSANYVYVDGRRYEKTTDANNPVLVKTITADANGVAQTASNCLPYGTYLIKEIQPVEGYLNSGWSRQFTIRSDGQMREYKANVAADRNEDHVIRGGVNVKKVDTDDKSIVPQGDAGTGATNAKTFAGTRYKVRNKSRHAVYIPNAHAYVSGTNLYAPEALCAFLVAEDDGIARLPGNALPYGTYEITEETAVNGYLVNSTWKQTIQIRSNGEIIDLTSTAKRLDDAVQRGGVKVEKVDYDRKDNITQGDAHETFAGTEYGIYNLSEHYVYVDGRRYEKTTDANNPVLVKTITADANGVAQTASNCLPYGTYLIKETRPVEGYLNSGWSRQFTIRGNGQMREYKANVATDRNEDPVMRGGIIIHKVDANSGSTVPQGDAGKLADDGATHTFAGTTYRIRNKSEHEVYIRDDAKPFVPNKHLYGDNEVCIEIVANENGIAQTVTNALPYGTYFVQEVAPPVGYENSNWGAEFQIRADGQVIVFDDASNASATRRNAEPVKRGGVSVAKVDAEWLLPFTQGDANRTFEGTQYQITNASDSYVYVDGQRYENGAVVKTITADGTGVATTGNYSLPYGTYTIKETAAATGYLINSAWEKTFTIREHGYMQYYRKEFESERVEDKVIRGGLEIHKYDADTKQPVPQGESRTFAGTKYVVRTLSPNDVHIKGDDCLYVPGQHDYSQGDKCVVLVSEANGIASLPADTLPYGTYEVMEVTPPAGYLNSYWKKTFSIRENGVIVTFNDAEGPYQRNEDPIAKGSVTVSKVDAETGYSMPQGNASLEGAEYSIVNTSGHSIIVGGQEYASGATCMVITSNASGMATSGTKTLPYGSYSISETKPPTGYANSGWSQTFTISHDGNEAAFVYSGNKNYEPVEKLKTGICIRKQDASYDDGVSGSGTLAGAVFTVRNISANSVLVNGTTYSVGSTILRLTTDTDGYAYIVAGTLPSGSYEVTEESAPAGYLRNSTWVGTFDVNADGTASATTLSCPDPVIRGDVKFRKIETGTQRGLPGIAFKITSVTTGESHIAITDSNGLLDTSSAAASRENGTANANDGAVTYHNIENIWTVDSGALDGANGIWFNGRKPGSVTPSNAVGALPYDTYEIEELRCDANRDYELVPPFRITITTEGYALASETIEDPRRTPPVIPGEHGNRVTVYKTADPAPNGLVSPGQVITYSVLARNTGADIQHKTLVRDYIPEGTEYVAGSVSDGGAYVVSSEGQSYVEWKIDDLLPRAEKTVTFQAKVLYDASQYIQNTAYTMEMPTDFTPGDPNNPKPTEESNTVTHRTGSTPTPASVQVVKLSTPVAGKQVAWRTDIKYTLRVENIGGSTAFMTGVYDKVPYGTELVSYTQENGGTVSGQAGRQGVGWLIPVLEMGQVINLEMTVRVVDRNAVQSLNTIGNQASWGDQSNLDFPRPPTNELSNTSNIVEHPLYESPSETSDTYKVSEPQGEAIVHKGDTIRYTLRTTNNLVRTKPYVQLRDYIPEHTSYVDGSATDNGAYVAADAPGNVTGKAYVEWVLANVAPHDVRDVAFSVTVAEEWNSYIRNIAYTRTTDTPVTAGDPSNPEPPTRTNEVKHRSPISDEPEDKFPLVKIVKSSDPAPGSTVVTGQEMTYYLDVTNDGKATAYDIMVFDAAPAGTTVTKVPRVSGATVSSTTPAQVNGAGWLIKQLGIGESVRLSLIVKVNATKGNERLPEVIRNEARWSYENVAVTDGTKEVPPLSDDGLDGRTNAVEHKVAPGPAIQSGSYVTCYKDAKPNPNSVVKAGDELEYVIKAINTGNASQEATLVRDYIPEGTEYIGNSATLNGAYVSADDSPDGKAYIEWVLGSMAPRETAQMSFRVRIVDGYRTYFANSASFGQCSKNDRPGDPSNEPPSETTNVVWHTTDASKPTPAAVQVVKESSPESGSEIARDETIRYLLKVTNTGGTVAKSYGVYDAVPDGLVVVEGSVSRDFGGTISADGSHVAWLIPELDPGKSVELSFEAEVAQNTTATTLDVIKNQASWGESDHLPDEPLENTSNIVELKVRREPVPVLTKEVLGSSHVSVGDEMSFVIKVKNMGNAPMTGWSLTDTPPAEMRYLADDAMGVLREDGSMLWRIDLQPGEEKIVNIKMVAIRAGTLPFSKNIASLSDETGREASISEAEFTVVMPQQLLQTGVGTISGVIGLVSGGVLSYDLIRRRKHMA